MFPGFRTPVNTTVFLKPPTTFLTCFSTGERRKYVSWLAVLQFNATLTAKVISWRSVTHVSWFSHTSANTTFFPKPPTTFLTNFSRGGLLNYDTKKVRLNRESNSQPPCHESDMLTTDPTRGGQKYARKKVCLNQVTNS